MIQSMIDFCRVKIVKPIEKKLKPIQNWLLAHRKSGVVIFAFFGGALSLIIVVCLVAPYVSDTGDKKILSFKFSEGFINSVYLIALALPLSYYLWFLRNEDKLVQIQYQKENNHFNSFSHAVSLFTEKEDKENTKDLPPGNGKKEEENPKEEYKVKNGLGLRLLVKLRKQGVFEQEIDMITSSGKDLSGVNLEGADLTGMNLKGANLIKANLEGAKLGGANLEGAKLGGANLERAKLGEANLAKAQLWRAHLSETYLEGASLAAANLTNANLEGAKLERASLTNANLEGAKLGGANLEGAKLGGATFLITENRFTESEIIPNRLSDYVWFEGSDPSNPRGVGLRLIPVKLISPDGKYYFEKIPS